MAKRKTISKLSDLTPDTANANKGTERGRYMVEASLTETGAGRSIVADKDGRIIAGNKTLEAWAGMGGAVKVVETDGHELVVVQRTDLDLSDPKGKARKLAYYDNRAGQVGLEWDAEQLLADVNAGVDLAAMFKADEIAELLAGVKGGDADAEPQIDQAEELNKKWQVKAGDLWRIGAHRLLCGDSTEEADLSRLMGGGKADMVFTDPPYGVNMTGAGGKSIAGDISFTAIPLFFAMVDRVLGEKGWAYVCGGQSNMLLYARMFEYYFRSLPKIIVWDKGKTAVMRHNGYHSCYELVFYAYREGGGNTWYGGRDSDSADDIWRVASPTDKERVHMAEKPVLIPARAIENSCPPAGVVFEPFAGGGATLVACENLGRKCRAIEISPAYCAVILERMAQAFPKLEITRDDGAG